MKTKPPLVTVLFQFGVMLVSLPIAVAAQTIDRPPAIAFSGSPQSQSIVLSNSVTLRVTATGSPPFQYQWRFNDQVLPDKTNNNLVISRVQATNDGLYSAVVMNAVGAVTSRVARLSVLPPLTALAARVFTNSPSERLPYRLFLPTNYSAAQTYPLVLFLHGIGERGTDNRIQITAQPHALSFVSYGRQASHPAFFAAPQCPSTRTWSDAVMVRQLLNLVDALANEFPIDTNRIYITGLSLGGYGVWSLLQERPDQFAAAVPIAGGGDTSRVASYKHVPLWNFHAVDDGSVPILQSRSMINALRLAGGCPIYTEYASGGHGIWPNAYSTPALVEWTMAQRRHEIPAAPNPGLWITNPPAADGSWATHAGVMDAGGQAMALGEPITQVRWTNGVNRTGGPATGANEWLASGIPLQSNQTNIVVITATTTSWSPTTGGSTTVNATLFAACDIPLRATLIAGQSQLTLNWSGGVPPFRIQSAPDLSRPEWREMATNATPPITVPMQSPAMFYRVLG